MEIIEDKEKLAAFWGVRHQSTVTMIVHGQALSRDIKNSWDRCVIEL